MIIYLFKVWMFSYILYLKYMNVMIFFYHMSRMLEHIINCQDFLWQSLSQNSSYSKNTFFPANHITHTRSTHNRTYILSACGMWEAIMDGEEVMISSFPVSSANGIAALALPCRVHQQATRLYLWSEAAWTSAYSDSSTSHLLWCPSLTSTGKPILWGYGPANFYLSQVVGNWLCDI